VYRSLGKLIKTFDNEANGIQIAQTGQNFENFFSISVILGMWQHGSN